MLWSFNDTPEHPIVPPKKHINRSGERFSYNEGTRPKTRPEGNVEIKKEKSYWFEVSTRDKHITLQTSQNDEEVTAYTIKLDTKTGELLIADTNDNSIHLNSLTRQMTLTALDVNVEANLWVRGNVNVNNNFKIAADSGNTWVGGGLAVDGNEVVDGDITTKSDHYTLGTSTVRGNSFIDGNQNIGQNQNVSKTLTCGALVITGPFSALGSASFGGGGGGAGTTFDDRGALSTNQPAAIQSTLAVSEDVTVAGNSDVGGDSNVGRNSTVGGNLTNSGNREVSGNQK